MDQTEYNLFQLLKEELYTFDSSLTNTELNSIARRLTMVIERYILTRKIPQSDV